MSSIWWTFIRRSIRRQIVFFLYSEKSWSVRADEDVLEGVGDLLVDRRHGRAALMGDVPDVLDQLLGHLRRGQDVVGQARGDGAVRHAAVLGRLLVLDHAHPDFALDGPEPQRPIRAGP
jgi:streptomycin 6-kinase